jgi:hypothetical protein
MRPTRSLSHPLPPLPQLSLPLRPTPINTLTAKDRVSVIAVLEQLLLEAARPWPKRGGDDAR